MNWQDFGVELVNKLLLELIPLVVPLVWSFVAVWAMKYYDKLPSNQQKFLQIAVETVVRSVEQVGFEDKLQEAVNKVSAKMEQAGYPIDLEAIVDAIEAEVHKMNKE